jgi:hypothetical protein
MTLTLAVGECDLMHCVSVSACSVGNAVTRESTRVV